MSKHYSLYIKNNDFLCSPNLFHSQADYYYHITKMDTAVAAAALIPKIFQSSCRDIMQELKHPQLKCEPWKLAALLPSGPEAGQGAGGADVRPPATPSPLCFQMLKELHKGCNNFNMEKSDGTTL